MYYILASYDHYMIIYAVYHYRRCYFGLASMVLISRMEVIPFIATCNAVFAMYQYILFKVFIELNLPFHALNNILTTLSLTIDNMFLSA